MIYTKKIHKGVAVLLFLFLFGYLFLRVLFNETLHDEIATFYFYFYHGDYIGETIQWDANNHLLNSVIGNLLYQIVGDNMSVLRLPNLLAFIPYFLGSYWLTKDLKTPYLKLTGLLALTCIPFVLDYFAYARGYGLSMGFLMLGLYHFMKYQQHFLNLNLFLTYLFLLLAVSANLTLINSVFIFIGLNIIAPFFQENQANFNRKKWLLHLFGFLGLVPFILFALILKHTGALYYGSLDGFWKVTGRSMSKMVFFYDGEILQLFFLITFVAFNILFFRILKSKQKDEWLKQPFILWINLLYGNGLAIVLMATLLKVNYPEDRTGMYLIIYFILAIIYFFDSISKFNWLHWSLLFFPITLITHLNLDTSIYSPEQRMNAEFYQKVKAQIEPSNSIMMYHTMFWNWAYYESHEKTKASVGQTNNPNTIISDIILTRDGVLKTPLIAQLYDTIAYHDVSKYIAFKRKEKTRKESLKSYSTKEYKGKDEFYNLGEFQSEDFVEKNLQVTVLGHLKTTHFKNRIQLVVDTKNNQNETIQRFYYSFDACYQGKKINNDFLHHFILENITDEEQKIIIYLWNIGQDYFEISNAKTELLLIKE